MYMTRDELVEKLEAMVEFELNRRDLARALIGGMDVVPPSIGLRLRMEEFVDRELRGFEVRS